MKQLLSTHGQRRLASWLVELMLIAAAGCTGAANEDTSTSAVTADPKVQAIAESSKSSRALRKAVVDELKSRQPAGKSSKRRTP